MNVYTCTGCGDTHLCPGRLDREAGPALAEQIRTYVEATYTRDPVGVVGTADAWNAYLTWCAATGTAPFSQRRFVAAMAAVPGIRRVKRSTMRFQGITWAHTHRPGRHAAPEPRAWA